MKKINIIILLVLLFSNFAYSQNDTINLSSVIIYSNKIPVTLRQNPSSVRVVDSTELSVLPKSIGIEEALRLVPGVTIDNQHDAERVHVSIRGQGILTERGIRGIGIIIDGIPVNDPSGFAPDLYDVEWDIVDKIEVLKGPASGIYGSAAAGGVIAISTKNGANKPFEAQISQTAGTNAFSKTFVDIAGSANNTNYNISFSHVQGNGYRVHQAFNGNILYEKINFKPVDKLDLTQIFSYSDYFQQNPEGLNIGQFDDLTQANPDAIPFNEYQQTQRTTFGLNAKYKFSKHQDITATAFVRPWNYKETSNKAAEYRDILFTGGNFQYNLHLGNSVKHNFSVGTDYKMQDIKLYKLQSASDPDRVDAPNDRLNLENDTLLANEIISQQSNSFFALYNLNFNKFNFLASVRYDDIKNQLLDKMLSADSNLTNMDFTNYSAKVGISYEASDIATIFADWSNGFIPPSTEELASNPLGYSGFNTHLTPATVNSFELGFRGNLKNSLKYDVTAFLMNTENDFFRFKQSGRGNQEVFYGNAGNSVRKGIETFFEYNVLKNLNIAVAYTFSDFKYTSATVDPIYTDTNYVLTKPPVAGQYLPNCPKHQLYAEVNYLPVKNLKLTLSTEYRSEWAIYTDADAYAGLLDPSVYQNWQEGYNLYHFRAAYNFNVKNTNFEISAFVRNLTNQAYIAFTEPDPDGNSYHPGPGREFFTTLKVKF